MDVEFDGINVNYGNTQVLHKVYGRAVRGKILAIIGPSGAGKTSLLGALAGRIPMTYGTVQLGGKVASKQLRRRIAYATQEDVFFPNLTLKETLMFHAVLRLPDTVSDNDKLLHVGSIIQQFDLTKCVNTIMGDITTRGLSGGEKKRANIACEMLNNVDVIIVDEPTSGLDSATAWQVMKLLQTYTETEHKTVIVTLHQPSSRIFHMCADIMVLSSGKVAYSGREEKVIEFLSNLGFQCPSYYNPADFILDKLKESEESENAIIEAARLPREQDQSTIISDEGSRDCTSKSGQINHAFTSDLSLAPSKSVSASTVSIELADESAMEERKWKTGFWTQYKTLCKRQMKQMAVRNFTISIILCDVLMAILIGLLWFQIPHTDDKIQSRQGLIFFCFLLFGFATKSNAISSFKLENIVMKRERAAGMYRLSAYYLSKITSEVITMVHPFFVYTFVYWMAGLNSQPWVFICSLLILEMAVITAAGIGTLLAILFDDLGTAMWTATNLYIAFMILGGFFVVNDTSWFQWTKYLSTLYFTTAASTKLEFLHGSNSASDTEVSNLTMCSSQVSLERFRSRLEESFPVWLDCVFILLYCVFFWTAGYVALRWVKKSH